jgi:hypothetical protein
MKEEYTLKYNTRYTRRKTVPFISDYVKYHKVLTCSKEVKK